MISTTASIPLCHLLMGALTSLLSAGLQTQEAADKAALALSKLQQEVQRQIYAARKDLSTLADATASEAAKLLTAKFDQANEAADAAAKRYEKAGRLLGLKTFAALVGCLAGIPSHEEIEFRRRQIAEMEAKAAVLAKKGVNLDWADCKTGLLKRTKPCFRSDGSVYAIEGTGRHYAVPYSSRH